MIGSDDCCDDADSEETPDSLVELLSRFALVDNALCDLVALQSVVPLTELLAEQSFLLQECIAQLFGAGSCEMTTISSSNSTFQLRSLAPALTR